MCSHFSKIFFAVYSQKADCSNVTSMLNAVAFHFFWGKKTPKQFNGLRWLSDTSKCETFAQLHIGNQLWCRSPVLPNIMFSVLWLKLFILVSDNVTIGKSIVMGMWIEDHTAPSLRSHTWKNVCLHFKRFVTFSKLKKGMSLSIHKYIYNNYSF